MIIKEFYLTRKDGVKLFKTYSDKDFYIVKRGTEEKYDIAIDVESAKFKYDETEEVIDRGYYAEQQTNGSKNQTDILPG